MVSGKLNPTSDKLLSTEIVCGVWVGSGVNVDVGADVGEAVSLSDCVSDGTRVAVWDWVAVGAGADEVA